MKAGDIKVGGLYRATVNGVLTVVRVEEIRPPSAIYRYQVTNTKTNKVTQFRSAAKFREPVETNDALVAGGNKLVETHIKLSASSSQPSIQNLPKPKAVSDFAVAMANKGKVGPTDTAPHLIVKARAGCLASDTIINVNRGGKGFKITIDKLVAQFTGESYQFSRTYQMRGKTVTATQKSRQWDLDIPTYVARAEGEVVRLGKVKDAWFSGNKRTYTITTTSGRSIRATAIHPFLTPDGWKKLGQLVVGDTVYVNTGRGAKGRSAEKKQYPTIFTKYHPNQSNNGDGRFKVAAHRLAIEADMNSVSLEDWVVVVRTDPNAVSNYKFLPPEHHVHHRDKDVTNYELSNLEVMRTVADHAAEHEWSNNVLWRVGTDMIESIQLYGIEPTYDIEVEDDPHNFLANEFVVHNTGKTTTIIQGLNALMGRTPTITPSAQQQAIWNMMLLSKGKVNSIGVVAFNKAIATELQQRVPYGVKAMTNHSLGLSSIRGTFQLLPGDRGINQYRVSDIIGELLGRDTRELRRTQPMLLPAVSHLVSLCKMNLVTANTQEEWADALDELVSHYDVELKSEDGRHNVKDAVYDLVPKVLEKCLDVARDQCIDYDDMIWLPVTLNLPIVQFDLLLVDEAQDLNRAQQELVKRCGARLVFVGDDRQAIYGFAGADAESLERLGKELGESDRGCEVLPLTQTRRCGRKIVAEAKAIVPDFEAHESNPEGVIKSIHRPLTLATPGRYSDLAQDGDMILCRCNAPLVSECFRFIKAGRRANIQGRDIGKGLKSLISKVTNDNPSMPVPELVGKLEDWLKAEASKEQARRNPSEGKIVGLNDKFDCLVVLTDGAKNALDVLTRIDSLFTDDRKTPGILLSSIHKAKGLEAKRVFLLEPERATVPHPMVKTAWGKKQEQNLRYVAITRAIEELVYVTEPKIEQEW